MKKVILILLLLSGCGGSNPLTVVVPPLPPPTISPYVEEVPDYVKLQFPTAQLVKSKGWSLYYVHELDVVVTPQEVSDAFSLAYDKVVAKTGKASNEIPLIYIYVKPNCQNLNGKWGICVEPNASNPGCITYMKQYYPWSLTPDGKCIVNGYTDLVSGYIPIRIYLNSEIRDPRHETIHVLWWDLFGGKECSDGIPEYSTVEHGFSCDPFKD